MIRFFFVVVVLCYFTHALSAQSSDAAPDLTERLSIASRADFKAKVVTHLKTLSDEDLKKVLNDTLKLSDFRSRAGYEPCLAEIVRRGGMQWEAFLRETFDALMEAKVKRHETSKELDSGSNFNLELLTALRRVSKQPDPLQIFIDEPKELTGMGSSMPNLRVRIQNVDIEKNGVGFTIGGNYRSGRQARWRIVVEDKNGKVIPVRAINSFAGGGMFGRGVLGHEETWETSLSIRSFIEVPAPGKYKLTVLYHNTQTIVDAANVDGLIFSKSKPVPFTIKPLTITRSKAEREKAEKLVAELDGKKSLKIVAGTYGEWAHKLVSPDSPEGKLLDMGLPAVPTVIESLHDKAITPKKRAWLFGVLYSLTGENDPRIGSVIGGYSYAESGWQVWGSLTGDQPSGGFSGGATGFSSGTINSQAQDELVKKWDQWLQKVNIKERAISDKEDTK